MAGTTEETITATIRMVTAEMAIAEVVTAAAAAATIPAASSVTVVTQTLAT
jgi:hypothetical protein